MSQLGSTTTKSLSYLTSSLSLTSIISRPRPGAVTNYVVRQQQNNNSVVGGVKHRRAISTNSSTTASSSQNNNNNNNNQNNINDNSNSTPSTSSNSNSRSNSFRNGHSNQSNGAREERRMLRRSGSSTGSNTTSPSSGSFVTPLFFDPSIPTSISLSTSSNSTSGSSRQFHNHSKQQHQPLASSSNSNSNSVVDGSTPYQPKHHSSSSSSSQPLLLLNPTPSADPSLGLTLPSLLSTSSSSSQPTFSINNSNNNNSTDRLTLFTSHSQSSYPSQNLPAFFGTTTTLNVARRGNLVFRNGAYGIPKVGDADYDRMRKNGKGKEKEKSEEERERGLIEHNLSVGIGEDAYFLRTDSLGVADGVGGWSGHAGANPARWSRKLMHHCSAELARYENVEDEMFLQYYEIDPVDVLQRAFEKSLIECKEEGVIGSSTALLAVLRNDELRLANMGDCCCSIIRGSDYIFRSEEQQHSFNFPVQAGTNSKDTPIKDAQRFIVKVQKDDIVILSSDGLVDNLFDEDILEEVLRFVASSPPPPLSPITSSLSGSRYTLNRFSPQLVAEALCHRAKSVYEDQRAVCSPFQQKAQEEGIHFAGGKRDDISTVIGVIGELEGSPDRR